MSSSSAPEQPDHGHQKRGAARAQARLLQREGHPSARGPRGRSTPSRHVHRHDRSARSSASGARGPRQLHRRGDERHLRPHRPVDLELRRDHGRGQRPGDPRRTAPDAEGCKGQADGRAAGRHDPPPRRRQVRRRRLQGLGRPTWRRGFRRERPRREHRRGGAPRRKGLYTVIRARKTDGRGPHDNQGAASAPAGAPVEGTAAGLRHGDALFRRFTNLPGHRVGSRRHHAVAPRNRIPEQRTLARPSRRAKWRRGELLLRRRPDQLRPPPESGARAPESAPGLRRAHVRQRDGCGGRAPVQRQLRREGVHVREQHQHDRRRRAPHRLPHRADSNDQRVRAQERGPQGIRPQPDVGRRPGGPHGGHQREDQGAAVRGADQDPPRKRGDRRPGRDCRERGAGAVPRGEPSRCAKDRREVPHRVPRTRGGAQGPGPRAAQGRARRLLATRQARRLSGT